ncbi:MULTISPECIES: phosphoribosyltransferase-like protein [Pseudoalteromonas]|uniref:phosphoribosyltransferase-like protein n=1 Tax=Pseudoalteromonas TaxID=53246 RepID=UPI00030A168A|nr:MULTISPECIES: hypothetical protein [Pseudoalteromonas]MCF6146386.1 hypothetical protein [Pseudoalteromonas mariniglutinosa NCIMB 1770]
MKISAIPSAQSWLEQFLPIDRKIAENLLDQLVYITTDDVINTLGVRINELIEGYNKVAIFPVRELIQVQEDETDGLEEAQQQTESYFPLDDDDAIPVVQPNNIPLGSEAFVSNLITQLGRRNRGKVISPEGNGLNPTLNNLRAERVDALILVDDLIGSGNRTKEFLESIYQHPTIKSWLSGKQIEIHIVSYMASEKGEKLINKWCNQYRNSTLHVLNQCPMLNMSDLDLISLCKRYADKGEKLPIGYGSNPVRVVFAHSAPNNLPAILYRNKAKLKAKDTSLRSKVKVWKALFPRRALVETLKAELSAVKPVTSIKYLLMELLQIVRLNPEISVISLNEQFSGTGAQLNLCKDRCINFGWLREDRAHLALTENGKKELRFINKINKLKIIANNEDNYYPNGMSRAMRHED